MCAVLWSRHASCSFHWVLYKRAVCVSMGVLVMMTPRKLNTASVWLLHVPAHAYLCAA